MDSAFYTSLLALSCVCPCKSIEPSLLGISTIRKPWVWVGGSLGAVSGARESIASSYLFESCGNLSRWLSQHFSVRPETASTIQRLDQVQAHLQQMQAQLGAIHHRRVHERDEMS